MTAQMAPATSTLPPPLTVQRRTALASSSAKALAAQISAWLSAEHQRDKSGQGSVGPDEEDALAAVAAAGDGLDVLTTALAGIRETLLGLDPMDAGRVRIAADGDADQRADRPVPTRCCSPAAWRGSPGCGWSTPSAGSSTCPDSVLAATEVATALQHPAGAPTLRLAPRFQRPSRLAFRFVDPRTLDGQPELEARIDQQHAELAISPVAGWLLPDHVDDALEVFDAAGDPLGQLLHDELTGAVTWEGAPGRPGPAGRVTRPGQRPGCAARDSFRRRLCRGGRTGPGAAAVPRGEQPLPPCCAPSTPPCGRSTRWARSGLGRSRDWWGGRSPSSGPPCGSTSWRTSTTCRSLRGAPRGRPVCRRTRRWPCALSPCGWAS